MRRRTVRQDVLSLSFLDLITCGLGATVLLFFAVVFSVGTTDDRGGTAGGRRHSGVFTAPRAGVDAGNEKGLRLSPYVTTEVSVSGELRADEVYWTDMPEGVEELMLVTRAERTVQTTLIVSSRGTPAGMRLHLAPSLAGRAVSTRTCVGPECGKWKSRVPVRDGNRLFVMEVDG